MPTNKWGKPIKIHYKGPALHGGKVTSDTLVTEVFEDITCQKCIEYIDRRGLNYNIPVADTPLESSNVQAYVDDISVNGRRPIKYRLDAASNAMLERNAARRKIEQEALQSVSVGKESLTVEEILELSHIGKRIIHSLSCDMNGDGLPCPIDREMAMEDMIRYLNIGMEGDK